MPHKLDTRDGRVRWFAERQHGLVTAKQLRRAGLGRSSLSDRVRAGRLHRVHRGVYSLSPVLSQEARWMAAVLACGDGAVLSHAAAASLWGLLKPVAGPVDVSIPSRSGRMRRDGIRLHRCPSLAADRRDADEIAMLVTRRNGIPLTTVPRTLADLRGTVAAKHMRSAIREAEHRGYHLGGIESDGSNSDLERDFLAFCRRHGIPRPEVNADVGGFEVDFLWRSQRLVVETDDFTYHRGSVAFDLDHERDLKLRAAGYAVHRYTGDQLDHEPELVAEDLRAALQARR